MVETKRWHRIGQQIESSSSLSKSIRFGSKTGVEKEMSKILSHGPFSFPPLIVRCLSFHCKKNNILNSYWSISAYRY